MREIANYKLKYKLKYNKNVKMFYFMNLSEAFNNKHLDFKQGPPGNVFKTRIYFVSHRPAFTAASARLEFISSLI